MDINHFNNFIRDLSLKLNLNLKHLIENIDNKNNKNNKNNKKKLNKKEIIIRENNERLYKNRIEDDEKKINYLLKNLNDNNKYNPISNLITIEGKSKYLLKLLELLWENKNKYLNDIIYLYLYLKDDNKDHDIINKIRIKLKDLNYKEYLMKECGNMLPPLNYWGYEKKLEDWQLKTIKLIKENKSILVRAPTSSGKSFIAMSAGIYHNKILYICPAKPIAYQIGSHFKYMGYKVNFVVDKIFTNNNNNNIYVGTPLEIENNINKLGIDFDYVVFDEIHNINHNELGSIYENLLKLFDCNILGVSASVNNIGYLKECYEKNHKNKKINIINYDKRFINHQNYIYDNKLIKIHPLSTINNNFNECYCEFTPNDIYRLWDYIDENIECDILGPDEYLQEDKLINLSDCKDYELYLKEEIKKLDNNNQNDIINNFKIKNNNNNNNLINFLKDIKKNDMLPMVIFNTNNIICEDLFDDIYKLLEGKEVEDYPYHYDILKLKNDLYNDYLDSLEEFKSKIKIKSKELLNDIHDKIDNFKLKEKNNYILKISNYYEKLLNKNKNKKLKEEYDEFLNNPDFNSQDIYKKHPDYCFNIGTPMSADIIRNIRREMKENLNININYDSPLFQMLKRGIGIYTDKMPEAYLFIIQRLLSNKEIGIVISDRTLCMGIDLPIRSSCLMEYKGNNDFTSEDYLQMGGRAGRRGLDCEGNILFYGDIDWKKLIQSPQPDIIGSKKPINENYLSSNLKNINRCIDKDYFINKEREYKLIKNYNKNIDNKLQWYLRDFLNSNEWILNLNNLEKIRCENDLIKKLIELLDIDIYDNYILKYYDNLYYKFYYYSLGIYKLINKNKYPNLYQLLGNINQYLEDLIYKKYLK